MIDLLVVLILLAVGVLCFGFYQIWLSVSKDNADQEVDVKFTVDPERIRDDLHKVRYLGQHGKATAGDPAVAGNEHGRQP
jgi:hypothetical protein